MQRYTGMAVQASKDRELEGGVRAGMVRSCGFGCGWITLVVWRLCFAVYVELGCRYTSSSLHRHGAAGEHGEGEGAGDRHRKRRGDKRVLCAVLILVLLCITSR